MLNIYDASLLFGACPVPRVRESLRCKSFVFGYHLSAVNLQARNGTTTRKKGAYIMTISSKPFVSSQYVWGDETKT